MNGFLEAKKVKMFPFCVLGLDSSEMNCLTSGKKECQPLTKEKLKVDFINPLFVIIILTLIVYELKSLTSVSEMRAYFKKVIFFMKVKHFCLV